MAIALVSIKYYNHIVFFNLKTKKIIKYYCGYGLVVEHVLAKDETGVRFSLAAQKSVL